MMELELDGTKFDELCDHAEYLEAEVMRLEKANRKMLEALLAIANEAGYWYNVTSDSHLYRIERMAREAL